MLSDIRIIKPTPDTRPRQRPFCPDRPAPVRSGPVRSEAERPGQAPATRPLDRPAASACPRLRSARQQSLDLRSGRTLWLPYNAAAARRNTTDGRSRTARWTDVSSTSTDDDGDEGNLAFGDNLPTHRTTGVQEGGALPTRGKSRGRKETASKLLTREEPHTETRDNLVCTPGHARFREDVEVDVCRVS